MVIKGYPLWYKEILIIDSGRVCMVIIDSGSFENVVSLEMVQKLKLETVPHPNPYQLCWLPKGNEIKVNKRCLVSFSIAQSYKDDFGVS